MTVKELIKKLQKFDKDKEIMVRGYESGWEKIDYIEKSRVYGKNMQWYEGTYQSIRNKNDTSITEKIDAILIVGKVEGV